MLGKKPKFHRLVSGVATTETAAQSQATIRMETDMLIANVLVTVACY